LTEKERRRWNQWENRRKKDLHRIWHEEVFLYLKEKKNPLFFGKLRKKVHEHWTL